MRRRGGRRARGREPHVVPRPGGRGGPGQRFAATSSVVRTALAPSPGSRTRWFRPPRGMVDGDCPGEARAAARNELVLWSMTRGGPASRPARRSWPTSSAACAPGRSSTCTTAPAPSRHDREAPGAPPRGARGAARAFLARSIAAGYRFVTVSELLHGTPVDAPPVVPAPSTHRRSLSPPNQTGRSIDGVDGSMPEVLVEDINPYPLAAPRCWPRTATSTSTCRPSRSRAAIRRPHPADRVGGVGGQPRPCTRAAGARRAPRRGPSADDGPRGAPRSPSAARRPKASRSSCGSRRATASPCSMTTGCSR